MHRSTPNHRHEPRPTLYVLCILLSTVLLLSLLACTSMGSGSENEPTDGSESPRVPSETTERQEEDSSADALSDYLALIEKLEQEIAELKTENFILSSLLEEKDSETDAALSIPYTYERDDNEITILSYTGKEKDVTVPTEIDGLPVTKIGESAFAGSAVTSVTLPASVEEIEWFAFSGCSHLTTLTGSASVTEVGYGAFDGCPSSLVIVAPKGSYLERYAKSFGIAVRN